MTLMTSGKSKSQIAVEFIVVYSVVLLIFLVFFATVANQRAASLSQQQYSVIQLVAQNVASYIDQAVVAGNGYNATVPIISSVGLAPYNISITNTGVVVASVTIGSQVFESTAASYAKNLQINGTIIAGNATGGTYLYNIPAYTGTLRIANRNGVIYIDKVPQNLNTTIFLGTKSSTFKVAVFNSVSPAIGFRNLASPSLNSVWNGFSWTIASWIYVTNAPSGSTILYSDNAGCVSGSYITNATTTGYSITVNTWNGIAGACSNAVQQTLVTGQIPYNTWVFALSTLHYNPGGSSWIAACYNAHCSNQSDTVTPPANYVGYYSGMNFTGFRCCNQGDAGMISDVQVYNTSLTMSQIQQLYGEGVDGVPVGNAGLVAWYPLNGSVQDYSGFNNAGYPNNVVYNNVAKITAQAYSANSGVTLLVQNSGASIYSGNTLIGFTAPYPASASASSGGTSILTGTNGTATTVYTSNSGSGIFNVTVNAFNGNITLYRNTNNPTNGLLYWFPLDEGGGGKVYDVIGGGNGTFLYPKWAPDPQNGSNIYGLGAVLPGNYITLGHSYLTGNSFTISGWVHWPSVFNPSQTFTIFKSGKSGSIVILSDSSGSWQMASGQGLLSQAQKSCGTIKAGVWYNYGIVYTETAASSNETLYINGTAICSWTPEYSTSTLVSSTLGPVNGTMTNFQIYNTSLTAAQMLAIYRSGPAGFPLAASQLEGWFPLAGNLNDYSIYGNNGIIGTNTVSISKMTVQPATSAGAPLYASFNGSTGGIEYNEPANAKVFLFQGSCNVTITAWSYLKGTSAFTTSNPNGYGTVQNIVTYGFAGCTINDLCDSENVSFTPTKAIFYTNNETLFRINGSYVGHWIFTVMDFNKGKFTGYLNGINVTGVPKYSGCFAGPALGIGNIATYSSQRNLPFNGSIADVQIYNFSLTPSQVQQLYTAGINPSTRVSLGSG